jgi:hypothetical protein
MLFKTGLALKLVIRIGNLGMIHGTSNGNGQLMIRGEDVSSHGSLYGKNIIITTEATKFHFQPLNFTEPVTVAQQSKA